MEEYKIDAGKDFGTWDDPVSKFMYFGVMPEILKHIDTEGKSVADYGGANGLLKTFIPQAVSIDIDGTKEPDIVDDIRTHQGEYDLIVIRYVLHYLSPPQRSKLFRHLRTFHKGDILVIQFTNDGNDLQVKRANSINETKYFENSSRLDWEIRKSGFRIVTHKQIGYEVTKEFYANRLNNPDGVAHNEVCHAYLLRGTT